MQQCNAATVLRGDCVIICDQQTIREYSLDGQVKRKVSYQEIKNFPQSICHVVDR